MIGIACQTGVEHSDVETIRNRGGIVDCQVIHHGRGCISAPVDGNSQFGIVQRLGALDRKLLDVTGPPQGRLHFTGGVVISADQEYANTGRFQLTELTDHPESRVHVHPFAVE